MSMRYNLKILLSVVVLIQFVSMESLDDKPVPHNTVSIVSDSQSSFVSNARSRLDLMMQIPFTGRQPSPREQGEIVAYMQAQDRIYREKYHMGYHEFNHVMRLGYEDFIHKAFDELKLSDAAIRELWHVYLDSSWWKRPSKIEVYGKVVEDKIKKRNKIQKAKQKAEQDAFDRQNKVQQEAVRIKAAELKLLDEQKAREKKAQQEQALLGQENKDHQEALIFCEQMVKQQYQSCDFDLADCPDRELEKQWSERQKALKEVIEQDFMQYDQVFNLTPQTIGFLAAHDIDCHDYQGFFGTALQQQLHGEMCDLLSQVATMQMQFSYQNNLQASVVEFADAAYDANKSEQVLLASRLMDVDWIVLRLSREIAMAAIPYAKAIASGVVHSATDFLHMAAHPIETCHGLGKALYFVLETAALNSSEEVLEYPEIYEPMRDKRNEEIAQVLQSLGNQMANSTGPERVEALTRFGADFVVPGKIIHAVSGVCGAIRSQAKIVRSLEGVASALKNDLWLEKTAHELVMATENIDVAVQECVGQSVATEIKKVKDVAKKRIKSSERVSHKQTNNKPKEVDTRCLLEKNLEIAEGVVERAAKIENLPDGRIRYYTKEVSSATPGPTRGSSYVTEYDPVRGVVRSWLECYDHSGNVNRVHPKMINGKAVDCLHYPHTKKELEMIALAKKGKNNA